MHAIIGTISRTPELMRTVLPPKKATIHITDEWQEHHIVANPLTGVAKLSPSDNHNGILDWRRNVDS
jgi:hypothetical protein